jgi:hypothetical protein
MNGNYKIADIKSMNPDLFDWEHSSRNTGETVMGLHVDDDGTFNLEIWLGLTPKGYTRDPKICKREEEQPDSVSDQYKNVAIALEYSNGEWFWMHISDYSIESVTLELIKTPIKISLASERGLGVVTGLTNG